MVQQPTHAPHPREPKEDEVIKEIAELTLDPNLQNLQTVVELHAEFAKESTDAAADALRGDFSEL